MGPGTGTSGKRTKIQEKQVLVRNMEGWGQGTRYHQLENQDPRDIIGTGTYSHGEGQGQVLLPKIPKQTQEANQDSSSLNAPLAQKGTPALPVELYQ